MATSSPTSRPEPSVKRTVAFFDGQNVFNAAKTAFGYTYPNYNPLALATRVCVAKGWSLAQTRFYTGMPSSVEDPSRHAFWTNKLVALRRDGIEPFTRPIRYRDKVTRWPGSVRIRLPDGTELPAGTSLYRADGTPLPRNTELRVRSADEKGVDIRLALDIVRLALDDSYDEALVFSQDQDLSEVAEEIRHIARSQSRWIRIACAFPDSAACLNRRGINKTDWIPIDKATYDTCIDPFDYRTGVPPLSAPPPLPPSPPPPAPV